MEEALEKIIHRCLPELSGGYHLPILARVESIPDTPNNEKISDEFRPYYSVDVQVLKPDLTDNEEIPVFENVPISVTNGGHEGQGFFSYPKEGTIVELAFAYGLASRPFIRGVLPLLSTTPNLKATEQLWNVGEGIEQRVTEQGNWTTNTHGNIEQESLNRIINAVANDESFASELKRVAGNSLENIEGLKKIVALGALRLLTGGSCNLSAGDNLSLTTANDLQYFVGRNQKNSVAENIETEIGQNFNEKIGKIKASIAKEEQRVQVENGGKVWIGNESDNTLKILSDIIQIVSDIANTCALHTHPNVSTPDQASTFSSNVIEASKLKSKLDSII